MPKFPNGGGSTALPVRMVWLWSVLAVCLYLPALDFGLFADDEIYLAFGNRALRDLPPAFLYRLLLAPANPWEFLPVRDLSYWLDLQAFGDDGWGLHFTNLGLYALSGWAVARFVRDALLYWGAWDRERAHFGGALAAAFFMLHPAHVEAVVWISGRKDLLAGLFSLMALALMLRANSRGLSLRPVAAALAAFVLACFSKSTALAMAPILGLVALTTPREAPMNTPRHRWVLVCLSLVLLVACIAWVHLHFGAEMQIRVDNSPGFAVASERASRIFFTLMRLLWLPTDLGLIHDIYMPGSWHWLVSAAAVVIGLGAAFWLACRGVSVVALASLLTLLPVLLYLQWPPFSTWSMASERFVFLSVAGLALLCALWGRRVANRQLYVVILTGLFFALAVQSAVRIADWRSAQQLFSHDYARLPHHPVVAFNYLLFVPAVDGGPVDRLATVSNGIQREDARELVVRYFELASLIRAARSANQSPDSSILCSQIKSLYALLERGRVGLWAERDMSISNLLRSIDRQLYYSLGDPKRQCAPIEGTDQ